MTKPRFQLHLSTAIVLMFVAGAFIALNFKVYPMSNNPKYWYQRREFTCCGWPAVLFSYNHQISVPTFEDTSLVFIHFPDHTPWEHGKLQIGGLLLNALVLVALICLTISICNWQIRRHKSSV